MLKETPIANWKPQEVKFHPFTHYFAGNMQKLPPEKKYVLVQLRGDSDRTPHCLAVGYLKFHAGEKSEPWFVTPGCSVGSGYGDARVVAWCDCLPENFEWPASGRSMGTQEGDHALGV